MPENRRKYRSGHIRRIAELTDHDTAMKICLAWGGHRVRIPCGTGNQPTRLEEVVGAEAAEILMRDLGDEYIEIPHEKANLALWLREQGYKKRHIAHVLRMSARSVQYLFNGPGIFTPRRRVVEYTRPAAVP